VRSMVLRRILVPLRLIEQVRSIEQNRNSKHNPLMGRKDPCPGSAVMPS
jgi:hypothetical protein